MYFRPGGRDDRKRYEYNFLVVQKYLINKCNNREIVTFFKEKDILNQMSHYQSMHMPL